MSRLARGEYLDPNEVQIFHVVSRCVRRAFLCGFDSHSGRSFEHRRKWIRERFEFLASVFAIDCLTFAVMSNHIHLVLRSRPDLVIGWSDRDVAIRWLKLCPPRSNGKTVAAREPDIAMIVNNPQRLAELRVRLSDISWWMRMTGQRIAQQANREDRCTGRFWEGRYKAQQLVDEAAVLACSMYVDLNPIRAAMAESVENSEFTGAKARIDDLKQDKPPQEELSQSGGSLECSNKGQESFKRNQPTDQWERSQDRVHSGWLSPLEIKESTDPIGAAPSPCGRRASLKGFIAMPLLRYLELLDWTGRQLRTDKPAAIPSSIAPILQRLGIDSSRWFDLAREFGQLFKRAAGSQISLSAEAERQGKSWLQAPGANCFS